MSDLLHKFAFKCLYTTTSGETFELLECELCHEGKLGNPRPGERGVMGPYRVHNGRDTCTPPDELLARSREADAFFDLAQTARAEALARRQEDVRLRAAHQGGSISDLPFSLEEARALYKAGYESGLERGADGGSFEAALRALGRGT